MTFTELSFILYIFSLKFDTIDLTQHGFGVSNLKDSVGSCSFSSFQKEKVQVLGGRLTLKQECLFSKKQNRRKRNEGR